MILILQKSVSAWKTENYYKGNWQIFERVSFTSKSKQIRRVEFNDI